MACLAFSTAASHSTFAKSAASAASRTVSSAENFPELAAATCDLAVSAALSAEATALRHACTSSVSPSSSAGEASLDAADLLADLSAAEAAADSSAEASEPEGEALALEAFFAAFLDTLESFAALADLPSLASSPDDFERERPLAGAGAEESSEADLRFLASEAELEARDEALEGMSSPARLGNVY